jgi:hypothetical protein
MEGRPLTDADVERFSVASGVISRAMEYVHGLG